MESNFNRKRSNDILHINKNIKEQELIMKRAVNKIERLKLKLDDAYTEYFCGFKISHEEERKLLYGINYELIIKLPERVRMTARVHPNAHEEESIRTFIARLELSHYYYGKIPYLIEFKSRSKYSIVDFESAKNIALEFLKEFLESIPNETN